MKKLFLLLCVAGLLLVSQTVSADLISGSGTWQSWLPSDLDQNGNPYWDNGSSDGAQKNIGYYLTGTGSYFSSLPYYEHPGAIPYWGTGSGGFDTNISFTKDSAYSNAALRLEIAGYMNYNEFGWYDFATGEKYKIFSGLDSKDASATFTPTEKYGFYMINKPGNVFMTQAGAWGSADANFQHFAVFLQSPTTYWIGIEDLLCGGDKDYNDMVIRVSSVPVPEPATMLLLGTGLIGLAGLGRKKLRK